MRYSDIDQEKLGARLPGVVALDLPQKFSILVWGAQWIEDDGCLLVNEHVAILANFIGTLRQRSGCPIPAVGTGAHACLKKIMRSSIPQFHRTLRIFRRACTGMQQRNGQQCKDLDFHDF